GVKIHPETGDIMDWRYQEGEDTLQHEVQEKTEQREIVLEAPITEEQIRELRVGDVVTINGMMYTGRDAIHK
ncbi:fumarate hydratase C-terminal domain-containing protein, partial [Klebsiella pneumoniae]|uniref:fumarate hydratase C-terminal domain-containing protein n=1 Tax=Klebsiella pneumoniae TaxID=573 RepID=UPI001966E2E9